MISFAAYTEHHASDPLSRFSFIRNDALGNERAQVCFVNAILFRSKKIKRTRQDMRPYKHIHVMC